MTAPKTLTLAVCVCQGVTLSDFVTPVDIISALNMADLPALSPIFGDVPYRVKVDILSPTMDPVKGLMPVPAILPTKTYSEALSSQYDIIWVPAGPFPDSQQLPKFKMMPDEELEFIKKQSPGAKYVLSVCGGSALLAIAGVLQNKKATTNKSYYHQSIALVNAINPDANVTWVPKARWVVDGNVWTSSGVTAGNDMAMAFLEHLVGPKVATIVRSQVELVSVKENEDPFAEFFKLA